MSGPLNLLTPGCVGPDSALDALISHDGALLLDLDETSYLRNSTEDFLDSARPGLPALLLLRLLDAIKPWRWTGGEPTRDVWRIRVLTILMPWLWRRWQQRVPALAERHGNRPLLAALATRQGRTVIVTSGFQRIVAPLVAALGLPLESLVAARLDSFEDRRRGKLALALDALGAEAVRHSAVLTDSLEDLPLLEHCALPLRVVWPDARYAPALQRVYLPGQYLTQIKRPGQRYLVRGILQEDFAFWVIASLASAMFPVLHVLGLLALLVSFWAIYERGYVDNDWVAEHFEDAPKLSAAYGKVGVATPRLQPWLWAAACGLLADYLLRWPGPVTAHDVLAWSAVLIATHVGFRIYNRIDKSSRIWMFPGLQVMRSASFVVLVPVGLSAALALGAHVLARWVPYYVYRMGGKDWPEAPFFLSRLLFFVLLWLMIGFARNFDGMLNGTALALLLWNIFRSRKDLLELFGAMHRIDRPPR